MLKIKYILALLLSLPVFVCAAEPFDLMADKPQMTPRKFTSTEPLTAVWNKHLSINPRDKDWSKWNMLTLELKNNSKTTATFIMRIVTPGKGGVKGFHYYYHIFKVKPGKEWQKFELPFSTLGISRKPAGFRQVNNFVLTNSGYPNGKDFSMETRNIKLFKYSAKEMELWKMRQPSLTGVTKDDVNKIKSFIPGGIYSTMPNYKDRAYWEKYPVSDFIRKRAGQKVNSKLPDEFGLELWKVARTIRYGTPNPDPVGRAATTKWEKHRTEIGRVLSSCVVMECKENKGRFIPQIVKALDLLMSSPMGWPGHDARDKVKTGWRYACLGAMPTAANLAMTAYLLDDKLPEATRKKINDNLQEWIFTPVRKTLQLPHNSNPASIHHRSWAMTWLNHNANITPFNYFLLLITAYAVPMEQEERAWLTANAIKGSQKYLTYFTKSGYTREGMSYWQMGFGAWLNLADFIKDATAGKVDLGKDPQIQKIAALGYNMQMSPGGLYPHFSDHGVAGKATPYSYLFYQKLNNFTGVGYYLKDMKGLEYYTATGVSLWSDVHNTAGSLKNNPDLKPAPERKPYFFDPEAQILISRNEPFDGKRPLSFAMKGGHNGEHHNHNDLGSFAIGFEKMFHCGDPGTPPYMSKTRRLVNSSKMHPVPVVNNKDQGYGAKSFAKVKSFKAQDGKVELALDLTRAYPEPLLKSLIRTAEHDRKARKITVTDDFAASKAIDFGGCLTSYLPIKKLSDTVWQVGGLKVEFFCTGGKLEFSSYTPDIEWRSKTKLNKLDYKFKKAAKQGKVSYKITPVSE